MLLINNVERHYFKEPSVNFKITDDDRLLSDNQLQLLKCSASLPFKFGGFDSLDDILTKLKVDLVVDPAVKYHEMPNDFLDDAEAYWKEQLEILRRDDCRDHDLLVKITDFVLPEIRRMRETHGKSLLLGCYDSKNKKVFLYLNAMKMVEDGTRMDELIVSVFAHEIMHAYFDRPMHKTFPYVIFVEEPLAEFGSLLYLKETKSLFYDWAHSFVAGKHTCYRFGAQFMDDYLEDISNGGVSSIREYLEAYKIKLDPILDMPTYSNGRLSLPSGSVPGANNNVSVTIGGQYINAKWEDVFKYPPRYFYDSATKTLGLDGEWNYDICRNSSSPMNIDIIIDVHIHHRDGFNYIYLGDTFTIDKPSHLDSILSKYGVIVSPANKQFYAKNEVLFSRSSNKPVLRKCGDDLYAIIRDGKYGVVDDNLRIVVPCIYDSIWRYDKNDLLEVRLNRKYGLVDKRGKELVSVIYDDVARNNDGTYTVTKSGATAKIDRNGMIVD